MDGYSCKDKQSMIEALDGDGPRSSAAQGLSDCRLDQTRAIIYGVLARLFDIEITPEFALELERVGVLDLLADVMPESRMNKVLPLDFELLATEFARLFLGPGIHISPYASIYREGDIKAGQLWGASTGEVNRFMEHYGLKLSKEGMISDHISVLFEFMAKVGRAKINAYAEKNKEACGEADKIQRRFFFSYINPWIDKFLMEVEQAKPLPFYASVVKFTSRFIAEEKEYLA